MTEPAHPPITARKPDPSIRTFADGDIEREDRLRRMMDDAFLESIDVGLMYVSDAAFERCKARWESMAR